MCSLLGYGYGVEQSKPSPNSICFSIFSILASILCSVNLDDLSCESVRVWVQAMEWSKCSSSHCAAVTFLGTVRTVVQGFQLLGNCSLGLSLCGICMLFIKIILDDVGASRGGHG
uniref:Uncharacterized protein n=1 Tax=Oryza meridionalis TaxID=40149 RepID=A0A0E0CK23_9ORYZ